jgi:PhzF family phenazine biosynthesis protein
MKQAEVTVVRAMTYNGKNGNPAGVVLNAAGITPEERQQIAVHAGHSETAFLERSPSGKYKLAFFTPARPIAYCGHATVATFALLKMRNLEERPVVEVEISDSVLRIFFENQSVFMEQHKPKYESLTPSETEEVLASLQISKDQLDPAFQPQVVDTGNRFILVAIRDRNDLSKLQPLQNQIAQISEKKNLVGFYVFLRTPGTHAATTRMFAPHYGIPEESATGMAAGPLASALIDNSFVAGPEVRLLQGEFMSPSSTSEIIALAEIKDSRVVGIRVGGKASIISAK